MIGNGEGFLTDLADSAQLDVTTPLAVDLKAKRL